MRCLVQQEQAAQQQHQIAAADALAKHLEQIGLEAHHPAQREQQQQARDHGKAQAQLARAVAELHRQAADQHRDEDDVVHAEHDLECGQHGEGDPDVRIQQKFHDGETEGQTRDMQSRRARCGSPFPKKV